MGGWLNERIENETREGISKRAEEKVQKMLKDGNVELLSFLKEPSTVTIEEIQNSQPMLALQNSATTPRMEAETYSEDDTDVDEPPPAQSIWCVSKHLLESDLILGKLMKHDQHVST